MLNAIKRTFRRLTPLEVATRELVEAELSKLEAETGREYASSLCAYHEARIKRLRSYIQEKSGDTL